MFRKAVEEMLERANRVEEERLRLGRELNGEAGGTGAATPGERPEKRGFILYLNSLPANILRMAVALMYTGRDACDLRAAYQGVAAWDKEVCVLKLMEKAQLANYLAQGLVLAGERNLDVDRADAFTGQPAGGVT